MVKRSMAMSRGLAVLFLFAFTAVAVGCVTPRHMPRYFDVNNPVRKVALLPMKNEIGRAHV